MLSHYLLSVPLLLGVSNILLGQKLPEYPAQVAGIPLRVSVRPAVKTISLNEDAELMVSLLDGDGKPALARDEVTIRLTVTDPAGRRSVLSPTIRRGASSEKQLFRPQMSGRYTIEAEDSRGKLLSDKYSLYVLPARRRAVSVPLEWLTLPPGVTAKPAPPPPAPPPPAAAQHRLILEFLARNEGVLADGKDAVTVAATYIHDSGAPAPADIKVWFRRSNGELSSRPLLIPKGQYEGKVLWTSEYLASNATIEVVSATAGIPLEGPRSFQTNFVRHVDGIRPIGPTTISLTERPSLVVWFVDHTGQLINVDTKRTLTFSMKKTGVDVAPQHKEVDAGTGAVTVLLSPVSLGQAMIQIDSEGLRSGSATYVVTVTLGSIVAIALLGGLVGGGVSFIKERRRLALKCSGGLAGGFVLAALYVFGAVPAFKGLPLNALSVSAVSLVGGYVGTEVLDWAWQKVKG